MWLENTEITEQYVGNESYAYNLPPVMIKKINKTLQATFSESGMYPYIFCKNHKTLDTPKFGVFADN